MKSALLLVPLVFAASPAFAMDGGVVSCVEVEQRLATVQRSLAACSDVGRREEAARQRCQAELEQAEEKLRRAGATTVFTPYTFIGHRLAQSMLRPHVLSFLDVASAFSGGGDLEIETEQLHISRDSPLCNRTLEEARVRQTYGLIVLALKKAGGGMIFNPEGNTRVETGDVLIAMGRRAELQRIGEALATRAGR